MTAFFITGTDTEIGKTFVTCTLLHAVRAKGLNVHGVTWLADHALFGQMRHPAPVTKHLLFFSERYFP